MFGYSAVNETPSNNPFNHKRHLQDSYDVQTPNKRRLVDHLNDLSLGFGSNPQSPFYKHKNGFNTKNNNMTSNSMFGSYTRDQLNSPMTDPNKVVIRNIDQFLHENPDQLDLIGEKLQLNDLKKAGLDKLVLSSGLDLKKVWNNILSQYKSKDNANKDINDIIYRLIWEDYLAKYFSLIKYYNPLKVVWDNYERWCNRQNSANSSKITEIYNNEDYNMNETNSNDYDDMMLDDEYDEEELARLAAREQHLRDGMSSYGSYYNHDDPEQFISAFDKYQNVYQHQPLVDDVDDIIMED